LANSATRSWTCAHSCEEYLAAPAMKKPEPDALFTNRFVGKVKLTSQEWAQVHERVAEFAKYVS